MAATGDEGESVTQRLHDVQVATLYWSRMRSRGRHGQERYRLLRP